MYLGWFDDNPKKPTARKIEEAIDAYVDRFKVRPNVVLVNEADYVDVAGVVVRKEGYIRRNNFWVGWEDAYHAASIPTPQPQSDAAPIESGDAMQMTLFEV